MKYKVHEGNRKFLFKKLAERLGVPAQLLNRKKQGFALPLVHWMRHELKDGMLQMLEEPRTMQRGYFNPASVREVLDEHFRGRRDHSGVLWIMLVFELWHRNYLEKVGKDSLHRASSCAAEGLFDKAPMRAGSGERTQ